MHHRASSLLFCVAADLFLTACGADAADPVEAPTAAAEQAAPPVEASEPPAPPAPETPTVFKPTFPRVLSRGGPVITKPKVVPIVFAGDPLSSQITSFTKKIATSSYWKGVASEYGVGAITAGDTIVVNEAAPATISSSEIDTWLQGKLSGASPAFGTPDPSTLYALFYPSTTTISLEEGGNTYGQSCQGYGGYHFEVEANGTQVGYAVMPRCSDLGELTVAASHEYFEWATDPFPQTNPAFNKLDDEHWAWQATMIGELSDLCTFLDREYLAPPEIGMTVQRHWSNQLSLSGGHPCAPVKSAPYFQAIPQAEDDAIVPDYAAPGSNIHTKAIRVPPGGTRTVDVLVYSDTAMTTNVPLRMMGYEAFYGGESTTGFKYELSASDAKPGTTVQLTITAPNVEAFDIAMTVAYTGPQSAYFWPVLVTSDKAPDPKAKSLMRATVTPESLPKRPQNDGINHRSRRGYGSMIESYAPVRASLVAERARASLPSSLMSDVEPRR